MFKYSYDDAECMSDAGESALEPQLDQTNEPELHSDVEKYTPKVLPEASQITPTAPVAVDTACIQHEHIDDHIEKLRQPTPTGDESQKHGIWKRVLVRSHGIKFLVGCALAFSAYFLIGLQAVLARYMQVDAGVPPLSLNALATTIAWIALFVPKLIFWIMRAVWRQCRRKRSTVPLSTEDAAQQKQRKQHFLNPSSMKRSQVRPLVGKIVATILIYACFSAVMLLRSVSNLLSSRFSMATYVQIVQMSLPFVTTILAFAVALVERCIISCIASYKARASGSPSTQSPPMVEKDTSDATAIVRRRQKFLKIITKLLPLTTFFWLTGMIIGGCAIVLGTVSRAESGEFTYVIQWSLIMDRFSSLDAIGCAFALCGVICQAMYNVSLAYITGLSGTGLNVQYVKLKNTDLNLFQLTVYAAGFQFLSHVVFREDWSSWLSIDSKAMVVMGMYSILVYLVSDIFYVISCYLIGGVNISAFMAVSLISAMSFSWIINGEPISNLFQIIGGCLTVVMVTSFLLSKRFFETRGRRKGQTAELNAGGDIENQAGEGTVSPNKFDSPVEAKVTVDLEQVDAHPDQRIEQVISEPRDERDREIPLKDVDSIEETPLP